LIIRTIHILLILTALLASRGADAQYLPERGEWLHFSYSKFLLLNAPDEMEQQWNSNGWQLMLMWETLFGRRSHWGIGFGPGFSVNYWYTNLNITTNPNGGPLNYTYLPSDSNYTCNRFSASYLDLPVEIRFRSNSDKKGRYFRFYFGGLVGYRINSFSQIKVGDYNIKHYRINDLSRWHYGVFVRTGYWLFNLYVYYGLDPVFGDLTSGEGVEGLDQMQSLSLGLSISL
jgi:hypothetical protein